MTIHNQFYPLLEQTDDPLDLPRTSALRADSVARGGFRATQRIFVSIASYRDSECESTVQQLFKMAMYPENINVGICQQNKSGDPDCITNSPWGSQIKIIRLPHYEARGPTWARYLCSTLWAGEEFYLQIDSHTKFVKDWDTKLISIINNIKASGLSQKPVLSHYPKSSTDYKPEVIEDYKVPRICQSFFNDRGMISFHGAEEINTQQRVYRSPYIAAGMIFAESKFLQEVPFDPHLDYLFVGEEILLSIRFYTHGWDIFTPSENIIFHEYTRKGKPKIWSDLKYSDQAASDKVKSLIGLQKKDIPQHLSNNIDKYGLGRVRSLRDYYKFAGINIKEKKVVKNFCHPERVVISSTWPNMLIFATCVLLFIILIIVLIMLISF